MKKLILLGMLSLVAFGCQNTLLKPISSSGVAENIKAPELLEFLGDTYQAGYSVADRRQALVEYYRPGERPKSWQKMLALRLESAGKNSFVQVKAMEGMVKASGNGVRAYHTAKGHGIEFILTTTDGRS
jgi:hypothetical protein